MAPTARPAPLAAPKAAAAASSSEAQGATRVEGYYESTQGPGLSSKVCPILFRILGLGSKTWGRRPGVKSTGFRIC